MSRFRFQILELRDSAPQKWLRLWAGQYQKDDDKEYWDLIGKGKSESLSAKDFEQIGKWKDGAKKDRWGPNVASVAYEIWMEAARKRPKCPDENDVESFLAQWSGKTCKYVFERKGRVEKRFGVPRATTLLHFISGGRFPMIDSRVRRAIARLCNDRVRPKNTVSWYQESFRPLFSELAALCKTEGDLRILDKALLSYGSKALVSYFSSEKSSSSN